MKSLVFVCDGAYVLALVPGDRRADERRRPRGGWGAVEVRVARADEVVHATGFEPGGVAPFPQRAITQTLMDRSFFAHEEVWIGAGTELAHGVAPPAELLRLAGAKTVDLGGRG